MYMQNSAKNLAMQQEYSPALIEKLAEAISAVLPIVIQRETECMLAAEIAASPGNSARNSPLES